MLVVDLHHAHTDLEHVVGGAVGDFVEDLEDRAGDDAAHVLVLEVGAHHGMRLARAGLALGEDGAVEPDEDVLDDGTRSKVEDVALERVHGVAPVEVESFLLVVADPVDCLTGILLKLQTDCFFV